ncbi:MAG: peptide chain release factor 1 [Planctomycetota bacterium]
MKDPFARRGPGAHHVMAEHGLELAPAIADKLREQAARHAELAELTADPELLADHKRMTEVLREQGGLLKITELAAEYETFVARLAEARQLLDDPDVEAEMAELAREELASLEEGFLDLDHRIKAALVSDPDLERTKIIVEIRAGAGGDEASLFARDLYEVYQRYIDEMPGWKIETISVKATEVGGMKEMIFGVQGEGAWRFLRFEAGGHRVQRVPDTESQGRIHTSAVTVAVLPEPEEVDIDIRPEDLRIDTMRASGAGGQHVNKTESAVRIVHIPTDTMVVCMDEKSQHKNRAQAMRVLRTRLFEVERQRLHDARAATRKEQVGSGNRNQRIRTYNYPQNRCTDHRLGQNFSLEQIKAGRLQPIFDELEEVDREEQIKLL